MNVAQQEKSLIISKTSWLSGKINGTSLCMRMGDRGQYV